MTFLKTAFNLGGSSSGVPEEIRDPHVEQIEAARYSFDIDTARC
jgi:hypothetical protein